MKTLFNKYRSARFVLFLALAAMLSLSGCARYAHDVNVLYEPSASVQGGSGVIYILMPAPRQTLSPDVKWVIGNVTDDENNKIDTVSSSRSPAEIIQAALVQELKKAGYTVIPSTKRQGDEQRIIDLTKADIKLEQISSLVDIKAKCQILVAMDVFKHGRLAKRLQYESTSSKADFKDRDLLAKNVLEDALESLMLKTIPDLHALFMK